jgi:hypothetical protein
MPTGYTADVQDGKVTDFPTFAMQCARAFGALVLMRDDPKDASIPEEQRPGSYYIESVQRDEVALGRLLTMSGPDCEAAAIKAHEAAVTYAADYLAKRRTERERYKAMIAKVEAWTPPSADHVNMKKFMLDQLNESLKFDCGGDYSPTVEPLLSGSGWRLQQIARAKESLERSRKSLAEEEERVRGRNKWVRELRESLKGHG